MHGLLDLFIFNLEHNLPTYFSVVNLLISAALLFSIFYTGKARNDKDGKYWLFLSIFFLYLSIDESSTIHETIGKILIAFLPRLPFDLTWLRFPWVILGIAVGIIIIIFLWKFYLRFPRRHKLLFALSAVIYTGGAIGMEIVSGFFFFDNPSFNVVYSLLTTVEESMEMTAVILFIYTLIDYDSALQPEPEAANAAISTSEG